MILDKEADNTHWRKDNTFNHDAEQTNRFEIRIRMKLDTCL